MFLFHKISFSGEGSGAILVRLHKFLHLESPFPVDPSSNVAATVSSVGTSGSPSNVGVPV